MVQAKYIFTQLKEIEFQKNLNLYIYGFNLIMQLLLFNQKLINFFQLIHHLEVNYKKYMNTESPAPDFPIQNSILRNSNILYSINLNSNLKLMNKPEIAFDQLKLKYNKQNKDDIQELKFILSTLLTYPSSDIAELHKNANRLGMMDHIDHFQDKIQHINNVDQFCPCCGFIKQTQKIKLCTNFSDINHLGISTYLFFHTLKHVIFLLTVLFFVYCIYALVTNVISSNVYRAEVSSEILKKYDSFYGFLVISLGSKQIHETSQDKQYFKIQCWIGTGLVALWGILFAIIKYRQRIKSLQIVRKTKKASDFTILIKNFPKNMEPHQLQQQLNQFYNKRSDIDDIFKIDEKVRVVKINKAIPFFLDKQNFDNDQLKQVNKKYFEYKKQFANWIKERKKLYQFSLPLQQRKEKIQYFFLLQKKRIQLYNQNAEKIKKYFMRKKNQDSLTVPAFVTFNNSLTKSSLTFIHQDSHSLFNFFLCKKQSRYFHFKSVGSSKQVMAQISKAPQPEDIIWANLGRTRCKAFEYKFMTYSVTLIILGISFGAVYGLSKIQADYTSRNQGATIQYLSIFISLVISTINVLIQQILRYVTKLQKSTTNTQYQISMAIKAVFALILNSIVIPILVNHFLEDNLYGVNGLAYDIFYLGITNSFLSPLIRIFDIEFYFFRLVKWYQNKPDSKILSNQQKLNFYTQHIEFQIGYEHIYVVNLFLFCCFFCSLQPIIVVFGITGLSIMFFAQKYALFNRSRRPVPANNFINTAMYQLIFLGPAFFTIGSFCWSNFFKTQFIGIAPNLTSAIISLVIFFLPYKKLIKIFNKKIERNQRFYQQDQIYFPSEYDRANPATSHKAIANYVKILQEKRKTLLKKSSLQIKNFQQELIKNNARNNLIRHSMCSELRNFDEIDQDSDDENILRKTFAVNYSNIHSHIYDKRYIDLRSSMPNFFRKQSNYINNAKQLIQANIDRQNLEKQILSSSNKQVTSDNITQDKVRSSQDLKNQRNSNQSPLSSRQSGKQLIIYQIDSPTINIPYDKERQKHKYFKKRSMLT